MIINLHLGLPKTATTTLQHTVFQKYEGVVYHGKSHDKNINQFLRDSLMLAWENFVSGQNVEKYLQDWTDSVLHCEQTNILISDEGLMQWKSPRHREAAHWVTLRNPKVDIPRQGSHPIVEFLEAILGRLPDNVKVRAILTLRNQSDFLGSLHAQTQDSIYSQTGIGNQDFVKRALMTQDSSLEFYEIVRDLQTTLGENNFLCIFYEDGLSHNSKEIAKFIGAENYGEQFEPELKLNSHRVANGSWETGRVLPRPLRVLYYELHKTGVGQKLLRAIRKSLPWTWNLIPTTTKTVNISEEQKRQIKSHFGSDVDKLSKIMGRDLHQLGY